MRAVVFRMETLIVEEEGGRDSGARGEGEGDWVWEDMVVGLGSMCDLLVGDVD